MTLEESITQLMSLWPMTLADQEKLRNYLRQFAEAIREDMGKFTVGDSLYGCHPTPEPKPEQCMCGTVNICMQHAKQYPPTDELPKEVRYAIETLCHRHSGNFIEGDLQALARLCFTVASRGRG